MNGRERVETFKARLESPYEKVSKELNIRAALEDEVKTADNIQWYERQMKIAKIVQKIGKEIGIEFTFSVDQGWSDEQPEPPPKDEERMDKYGNAMKLYCGADKIKQALLSTKLVEGTARIMMKHYPRRTGGDGGLRP